MNGTMAVCTQGQQCKAGVWQRAKVTEITGFMAWEGLYSLFFAIVIK